MLLCKMIIIWVSIFTFSADGGSSISVCSGDVLANYTTCTGGSECGYQFKIGLCISCDNTSCDVIQGACCLDLEINDFLTANPESGKYTYLSKLKSCQNINDEVCGVLNRDGFLCSQCKPGYGPAPYSSDVKCFKCSDDNSSRQWLLYLALELVPSTVFFLVVILFNVRTTAPPYTAFVFFSQFFALLYKVHPYIRVSLKSWVNKILLHGILTLTSFWNLDFFRHVVPPFCISSRLTDLDVVLLECISAFYPLLLVRNVWSSSTKEEVATL